MEVTEQDKMSVVSGFDDEIDEWAALNKYRLYQEFTEAEEKKSESKKRQ